VLGHGSTKSSLRNALPWLIVAACIALGYQTMRAPAPRQPDSAISFSAERAFEHIRAIAVEPHPMGSAANARVRAYIGETLVELGVDVEMQELVAPDYFGNGGPVAVVNVIGRISGTANSGAIALVAHYDTVPATTGANDNSTGVATLLETASALLAGPPPNNDVLLVFTDGEEPAPRPGAKAFVASFPALSEIGLVVNFEASGSGGASLLIETNGPDAWLTGELAGTGSKPAAFSFLTTPAGFWAISGATSTNFATPGQPACILPTYTVHPSITRRPTASMPPASGPSSITVIKPSGSHTASESTTSPSHRHREAPSSSLSGHSPLAIQHRGLFH
jgi:hypothetical protein